MNCFAAFLRYLPRVGNARNLHAGTCIFFGYRSLLVRSKLVQRGSRLVGDLRGCFRCSFLSQQCSEANALSKLKEQISESAHVLENGTLLQFRKPGDDWLHWGFLLSKEEEKYRVLSLEGSLYEVAYKQIHPLHVSCDSLENKLAVEMSWIRKKEDHIVISPKVLEELSQVPDSKFPEYLCSLGEMIKHYILLLNGWNLLSASIPEKSIYHSDNTSTSCEVLCSNEQSGRKEEISRISCKPFEEVLSALERHSLKLVDKQRAEDPLAIEILRKLGYSVSPLSSFQLLVELGHYSYYENLFLRASRFSDGFHEGCLNSGDEILEHWKYLIDNSRELFCRVVKEETCFSIDDSDTVEIDDAISLDCRNDEYVWVHVADTSAYIPFESLLMTEAVRRGSSIYLPEEKIGMFPMHMAQLLLSLGSRYGLNFALSIGFRILPDGKLQDVQICKSIIKSPFRLNYDMAERVIDESTFASHRMMERDRRCLLRLYGLAERRRKYRLMNGAVEFSVNETDLKVALDDKGKPSFQFHDYSTESKSSFLVKEMMLAAGEAVALYGQEKGWILPYRGQDKVEIPPQVSSIPEGVVKSNQLLKFMKPSFISYRPVAHSSLGLPCYIQITSPIRRATDLLSHYQLSNYLGREMPLMSVEQFTSYVKLAQEGAKEAKIVEKRTLKYWCLEYLRVNGVGNKYPATVVSWIKSEDPKRILVQIEKIPYYFMVECDQVYHPGHQVVVKVMEVHPRIGILKLNIVSNV